jgi:integrase/recombinase XerD
VKVNRHDQAKILSPEIAWLFDGKVGLISDLKLSHEMRNEALRS